MGRRGAVNDLVGAGEVAELLGFTHVQSLHTLRRRHPSFPAPVATMKGGAMVWALPTATEQARNQRRHAG